MTTNPEDTGLFNPEIKEWTDLVHKAGGLCVHDQANANGVIGISRSREAGFDLCHFNLHKTFSIPHGSYGGGTGAVGVRNDLECYLPKPRITFDGDKYDLDFDRPNSIGTVRSYLGNIQAQVKAFAWIMALGEEGIRKVAEIAVLNNNYLTKKIAEIRGILELSGAKTVFSSVEFLSDLGALRSSGLEIINLISLGNRGLEKILCIAMTIEGHEFEAEAGKSGIIPKNVFG